MCRLRICSLFHLSYPKPGDRVMFFTKGFRAVSCVEYSDLNIHLQTFQEAFDKKFFIGFLGLIWLIRTLYSSAHTRNIFAINFGLLSTIRFCGFSLVSMSLSNIWLTVFAQLTYPHGWWDIPVHRYHGSRDSGRFFRKRYYHEQSQAPTVRWSSSYPTRGPQRNGEFLF